jgi:hypothetical protein
MDMVLVEKLRSEDIKKVHKQYNFCDTCRPRGTFGGCIRCALMKLQHLIYTLDRAMADPEEVARHTADVGDWVSGLDLTYGEEDVIKRAIERVKK